MLNITRFEILPNEILLFLFQYFNAKDLFQAFANLNSRLNQLIQSFHQLHLVFHLTNSDYQINRFFSCVYTLTIDHGIDVNLRHFSNIHRLKLDSISRTILAQLNVNILPHLKHLKLYYPGLLTAANQPIAFDILKHGCTNCLNYERILFSCPKLKFLDIGLTAYYQPFPNLIFHSNLQRLIIRMGDIAFASIDPIMSSYLSSVPNLVQLTIHLAISNSTILKLYLDYDWFNRVVRNCLPLLQRFRLHLYLSNLNELNQMEIENIQKRMKTNFVNIYQNQYQSQLLIC